MSSPLSSFPLGEWAAMLLDWKFPVVISAVYFVAVSFINSQIRNALESSKAAAKKTKEVARESVVFKSLVFLHNVALCVFSAACFVGMAPRWIRNFTERPFFEAFCDRDNTVWTSGLHYWSWLFYLSKYYEIMDTIIILIKGRPSSLLQSYHHAGAIITMFLCVRSQATATWIFVVFNSFIHTIMYFYYALTTVGIHPPKQAKKMLTTMQISQFLIGGSLATSYVLIPGCLKMQEGLVGEEILAYGSTIGYLVPLTYLFVDFARRTYSEFMAKKAAAASSAKAAKSQ